MNRKNRLFAFVIVAVLCFSMFSAVRVFAVGEEDTGEQNTVIFFDSGSYEEPTSDTQQYSSETYSTYSEPVYETETYEEVETETEYTYETETQKKKKSTSSYSYDETEQTYKKQETQATTWEEEEYSYSNSYEERESNTSDEKADTAAVFDAEEDDVSTDNLKKGDWAKIAEQLKSGNENDSDDFAFIRNNDARGGNNGEWMVILGIAMEAVGIAIITALIIMRSKRKKAIQNGHFNDNDKRPPSSGGSRPSGPSRMTKEQKYSKRKRSKFDTAEITVPRHAQQQSGGKRYKPKH